MSDDRKIDTETRGVAAFLDDLDDVLPSMVWALIDVVLGALALSIAWEAFDDGRWVITVVAALAGLFLFIVALSRLYRWYDGGNG